MIFILMGWKQRLGLTMLLGCTALIPAVSVNAATTYSRSKAKTVATKPYYAKAKKGSTYKLSGKAKKTKLKANHALKNYMSTTWMRSKTMTLTHKGKKTTYYYVKNAKNGATGWVASSYLKAGKNFQGTTAKKSSGRYQRAKAGKLYQFTASNTYVKFASGQNLSATAVYTRTKTRNVYKKGIKYQYDYVTSGQTHGWVWHNYLKTAKKIVAKPTTVAKVDGHTTENATVDGVTYYSTSGNVLDPYSASDFKTVDVDSQYQMGTIDYAKTALYVNNNSFEKTSDTLGVLRHTDDSYSNYSLKTAMYLPIDFKNTATNGFTRKSVLGDPQSATFSKDDQYLYVMYVDSTETTGANQTGWVIRYDWNKLTALGASNSGTMDMIRRATNRDYYGKGTKKQKALDKKVLACIKVGPKFKSGHAQSLALNPKTNELWFVKAYKEKAEATVQRLNATTLTPDASVNFTLKSTVCMGSTLAFDNDGNAYFWTETRSPWKTAPVDSLKFYKGTLSTSEVHFKLIMQGLTHSPGAVVQSSSFNPNNGRFYMVSDESIFSVPVDKIGDLTTADVSATNFDGKREFEGLIFKHTSDTGYVLANKGPELMEMMK